MSYNIDSSEMTGKLFMKRSTAQELYAQYKDDLPECNFFDHMDFQKGDGEELLSLGQYFHWYGCGSGGAYEFLPELLEHTTGKATISFVWEGGDSITALKIKDSVVTEKKAKIVIED